MDARAAFACRLKARGSKKFLETVLVNEMHGRTNQAMDPSALRARLRDGSLLETRAWLASGKRIAVTNLPTSFGPLSYTLAAKGGSVEASIEVPSRTPPRALTLRLRLPAGERLGAVTVDGRPDGRVDPATSTIDLSGSTGRVTLVARVERARRTS